MWNLWHCIAAVACCNLLLFMLLALFMHRHLETNRAKIQPYERVGLPFFNCNTDKPMMEMVADSNVWYQAAILRETANEIRVLFPGTKLAESAHGIQPHLMKLMVHVHNFTWSF